jgi:general secretion pathway protein H
MVYAVAPIRVGGGASGTELRAASRSVAAGLRHARAVAVAQRVEAVFQLDIGKKKFAVTGDTREHVLPQSVELKMFTGQQEVSSDQVAAIRFYPDGGATGGRVTVANAERKYEVDVDWMTGRVSISD